MFGRIRKAIAILGSGRMGGLWGVECLRGRMEISTRESGV